MRLLRVAVLALAATSLGASCGQSLVSVMPGVINDPRNASLRKAILDFGLNQAVCNDALKKSVPLRLRGEDPSIGRFFVTRCFAKNSDEHGFQVQFGGFGYVWTNVTDRLSFEAGSTVSYAVDFRIDDGAMYVTFDPLPPLSRTFDVRLVEHPVASAVAGFPFGPNGKSVADAIGGELFASELTMGFTVVRDSDGGTSISPGHLAKGQRPTSAKPYRVASGGPVLANDRAEIHANQRDYVGPLEVPEGKSMTITISIDGAASVDAILVPRSVGEPWLLTYMSQAQTTPPPGLPVLVDEPVLYGAVWRKKISLAAGYYYLVLDNTATAGRTAPPAILHDDRAVLVRYGVQLE